MKYVLGLLILSMLLVSACSSNEVGEDNLFLEDESDDVSEDLEEDILPELVDSDEYIEIGEMI